MNEKIRELRKITKEMKTRKLGPVAYERRCQRNLILRRELIAEGWTPEQISAAIQK
jgi:hypothetical protein